MDELNQETRHVAVVTAADAELALAKIEELETTAIISAVEGHVSETWIYKIPGVGENLSVVGVENAAREMAIRKEPIREIDCALVFEDADEARFLARAGRYAITEDGREILLDTAIRAKRVSKTIKVTSPDVARKHGIQVGERIPNEHWFEVGVAKANRNAKLALLPEEVREFIMDKAMKGDGRAKQQKTPKKQEPPAGNLAEARSAAMAAIKGSSLTKAQKRELLKAKAPHVLIEEGNEYTVNPSKMNLADCNAIIDALMEKPPDPEPTGADAPLPEE